MKIIKPNAEYIDANNNHPYKIMEKAGRTCYKSEKNITDESAAKFVQKMAENKHTAMLEHAHIYMTVSNSIMDILIDCVKYAKTFDEGEDLAEPFLNITKFKPNDCKGTPKNYVSGSFRTFINMFDEDTGFYNRLEEMYGALNKAYPQLFPERREMSEPDEQITILSRREFIDDVKTVTKDNTTQCTEILKKHLTHTVVFTVDRGVTHEFVRHRTASFAQESTRYCTYSRDAFGKEITVIDPCFWDKDSEAYKIWKESCEASEKAYVKLTEIGCVAQQARDVLPTSLKAELVITATENEWQHIINLRYHGTTGAPHPQIKESMEIIYPVLIKESDNRLQ